MESLQPTQPFELGSRVHGLWLDLIQPIRGNHLFQFRKEQLGLLIHGAFHFLNRPSFEVVDDELTLGNLENLGYIFRTYRKHGLGLAILSVLKLCLV